MYPLTHFGKIPPKYYNDILRFAKDREFWDIVKDGFGINFLTKIKPFVMCGSWPLIEKEFLAQKWVLTLRALSKARIPEAMSFVLFVTSNFKELIIPSGLFIAIIGPDGCGKSTIQKNLQPFFDKGFTKGKTKKYYWRPFLLPRIKYLLPGVKKNYTGNPDKDSSARLELRKARIHRRLIHCIKLLYYWFDYILVESNIKAHGREEA